MLDLTDVLREAMLDHALAEFPRESCGLVLRDSQGRLYYFRARNLMPEGEEGKDRFVLDPASWCEAEEEGRIEAIVHSHPNATAIPSMFDRVSCAKSRYPWFIVACPAGAIKRIDPDGWSAPLVGRTFHHGVLDCYTLLQDYYLRRLDITLPDFERDDEWWARPEGAPGSDLYATQFEQAGFVQVLGAPQVHDVLMMQVAAHRWNHAAIYTGNDRILHHLHGRVSCHDTFDDAWRDRTKAVLRHIHRIRPSDAVWELMAA